MCSRFHYTPRRALLSLAMLAVALAPGAGFAAAAETPPAFHVEEATIADIQQAILAKKLTTTELVHLYLARIKAYNGPGVEMPDGPLAPVKPVQHAKGVNALITLNLRPATRQALGFDDHKARSLTDTADDDPRMPDALETAAALDAAFAKTGQLAGPLHGVVIAVKDQYDTFDLRTTSGADAFYANDRPPDDATFVARLRAAGAIILAKTNMGEYAAGIRSAFGGTTVNAYDTSRVPGGSSGGAGVATAMSFVTVSIGEESGPSIRAPSTYSNAVGISPTQELVSRDGLINNGLNTRTGPIARTVEDAARVLSVIAGYDPKDEMTAFAVGRTPDAPYETFTHEKSLQGLRIGVVREYMDKKVFAEPIYHPSIDRVNEAIEDLRKLGATLVEGGPDGLFTDTIRRYGPKVNNATWTKLHPELFPVDADGKPVGDHLSTLVALSLDPSKVPGSLTMRDFVDATADATGESRYGFTWYLQERGDANIRTMEDLIGKANFFTDTAEADKRITLGNTNKPRVYETAYRLQRRFAVQQIVLACMAEQKLDAIVYPTSNLSPRVIGMPRDPNAYGIGNYGLWNFIPAQGFPAITVPAGFTTEVYDRVPDPDAPAPAGGGDAPVKIIGPVKAELPVGVDFLGRPFSEPLLLKIAAAYESATKHRRPPPDFGPVP
ncbi:amidase [Opitutaceae bacterium TAV5]|nr:amidase [Opitutaceae bacterium TAV5]